MSIRFFISFMYTKEDGFYGVGNSEALNKDEHVTMEIIRGWEKTIGEIFGFKFVNIMFYNILR